MARFYFHLQDGGELIPDQEGTDLPDCETPKQEALHSARELLSNAIRTGKPKVPEAFVIADEAGQMLDVVPLAADGLAGYDGGDFTNDRGSGVDSPIHHANPDRRRHTLEVPHTRA